MKKTIISTAKAPKAIGTYSQAVKAGDTVYLSGQIPLVPETMEIDKGEHARADRTRVRQPFGGRFGRRWELTRRGQGQYLPD